MATIPARRSGAAGTRRTALTAAGMLVAAAAAVAMFALALPVPSSPFVSAAFASEEPSAPPAPAVWSGPLTTPTVLELMWGPSTTASGALPASYTLTIDDVTQPSQPATDGPQHVMVWPLVPGSSHECTVVAWAFGLPSPATTATLTLPRAPVRLGRPSLPSSGRRGVAFKVSGRVVSAYRAGRSTAVKLKVYRHRKTRSGRWYWDLRTTVAARRVSSTTYSVWLPLRKAGHYSVVAQAYANGVHLGDRSKRSRTVTIR